MASKVSVHSLFKVFGPRPELALELLAAGRGKEDILAETGMTVGVQDVSFSVDAGEIFVVMGLSGSGKSTLVRMLNRLIEPTSGEILIDGTDMASADARLMRRLRLDKVTMVFQHFALFPHKTVAENVAYGLKVRGVGKEERRERALASLERVGLAAWADQRPRALSGGMQQRVGLARALAVDAEILLMDEPFSALDPLIRRDMQAELVQLQRELNKTIIFITHDLHEALILGDHIAIMKAGRFVQVGTAQEIVGEPADDYVAAFTQDIDRARVFTADSVLEEAHALDLARDTPASALERMARLDRDALHVLDDGRLAGIVTYRGLAEQGASNGSGLAAALVRGVPTAPRDAHLYRLYGLCAGGLPVALLDDDGRLAGVAEPQAVFAQIAIADALPEQAAAPPAP
mgnify:CR=1 FL=1